MGPVDRKIIIQEINQVLAEQGFETSNVYERSCFDMAARKELLLLLLKVLVNIDSINVSSAEEIRKISHTLMASPLIVGLKTKNEPLEEDVVYERHGIPVIGVETLRNMILYNDHPEILADRGGYYVQINGNLLREVREEYNLSLKDLANLAHVSRATIYKYENELVRASPETAILLEDILNIKITLDIDVFKVPELNTSQVNPRQVLSNRDTDNLSKLGYGVISTSRTPFDALAKLESVKKVNDNPIIANLERDRTSKTIEKMAITLKDLSLVTDSEAVFIVDNDDFKESIDGIPVIRNWELKTIDNPNDFIKILKERKD